MHVEVAQRLLPLGERLGRRAVLPACVPECAEGARGLEHGAWVLFGVVVLGVVFVRIAVGCDGGL